MEDKNLKIKWFVKKAIISDLKEWAKNPRKITNEEYQKLIENIKKYGFHDVLKIDEDGTILSGHQRKRALKEMGITEVNVLYPERPLTEKERDHIAIISNRHQGMFDFDALANEFSVEDLIEAGFQPFELGFATSKDEEGTDTDTLGSSMNSYLRGNVKQITLNFNNEDYEEVCLRLDAIMNESGLKSHTDVFLTMLEQYENNHSTKETAR